MTNVRNLLEKCRILGATFTPMNDRFRVNAPFPLPDELVSALKGAKPQILTELRRELRGQAECWLLEEWRSTSIPSWRRVLHESINSRDAEREEYARWMLREILEDPEYMEEA